MSSRKKSRKLTKKKISKSNRKRNLKKNKISKKKKGGFINNINNDKNKLIKLGKFEQPYLKLNRTLTHKEIQYLLNSKEFNKVIISRNNTINTFKNTPVYNLFKSILDESLKYYKKEYYDNKILLYRIKQNNKDFGHIGLERYNETTAQNIKGRKTRIGIIYIMLDIDKNLKNKGAINFPIPIKKITKKKNFWGNKTYNKIEKTYTNKYSYFPKTGEVICIDPTANFRFAKINERSNKILDKNRYVLEIMILAPSF